MIKSLRESKAELAELVERASQGEDVLITVRGEVKARLTRALPRADNADIRGWAAELERLHSSVGTDDHRLPSETVLSEDRSAAVDD